MVLSEMLETLALSMEILYEKYIMQFWIEINRTNHDDEDNGGTRRPVLIAYINLTFLPCDCDVAPPQ